jgi:hypothetical protein
MLPAYVTAAMKHPGAVPARMLMLRKSTLCISTPGVFVLEYATFIREAVPGQHRNIDDANSGEKNPSPKHPRKLPTSLNGSDLYEAKPRSHTVGLSVNNGMHCGVFLEVDGTRNPL